MVTVLLLILIGIGIGQFNRWTRKDRAAMTEQQRRAEDDEIRRERNVY